MDTQFDKLTEAESILREFVSDINAVGGIMPDEDEEGVDVLVVDEEWVDLAATYRRACNFLGIELD